MKKIFIILTAALIGLGCSAGKVLLSADNSPVISSMDLVNVVEDRVLVTLDPGAFGPKPVNFYIPEIVPGTYSIDNYGKYIEDLKALDYEGRELKVSRNGTNSWQISEGGQLDKISYYVNDTYDTEQSVKNAVFSPAGTNIIAGETFMLNLHGFIGYFEGYKEVPYELHILVPEGLNSTTSLPKKDLVDSRDGREVFVAGRYFEVTDNPILYTSSKKESFRLNDITVNISLYSPNKVYKASDLRESMQRMMEAQKAFLGEIDGTNEYNILLHLSNMEETDAGGFGALEHHTSTVVVLPETLPQPNLEQAMVDVVSHEFFHIVTPLNIHSREIHYFDYNNPLMSKHLWMYEGTTEYFNNLFQINQGLIDEAGFYSRMMEKIQRSMAYDNAMSFTVMSENILKDPYKDNYANVYEKGALINMALDIRLRELSQGKMGVLRLMKKLTETYDASTPFEDDALIDDIVALTFPEIRDFFDTHVIGDQPIDYSQYLAKVGLTTSVSTQPSGYFLDGDMAFIDIDPTQDNAIFIREGIPLNSFFTSLGAKGGDVIKSIDGTSINLDAIRPIIGESFSWEPEQEITMVVIRGQQELVLRGAVGNPTVEVEQMVPAESVSEQQLSLRRAWLKG